MQFSTRNWRLLIVLTVMITAILPCVTSTSHRLVAADPSTAGGDARSPGDGRFADRNLDGQPGRSQMREGTLIPPMSGRIVLVGRRWAFLPDGLESESARVTSSASSAAASSSPFEFPKPNNRPTQLGDTSPIDPYAAPAPSLDASLSSSPETSGQLGRPKSQILICENVMLQRVVEAVRLDASDDRWTVSGEITEFFDENRLLIRTAQRANAK
jgi:hypothetical protein